MIALKLQYSFTNNLSPLLNNTIVIHSSAGILSKSISNSSPASLMLRTFPFGALTILIIAILNSLSGHSKICVISESESGTDADFMSLDCMFSFLLACFVHFHRKPTLHIR